MVQWKKYSLESGNIINMINDVICNYCYHTLRRNFLKLIQPFTSRWLAEKLHAGVLA